MIDLDEMVDHYAGSAAAYDDTAAPGTFASIRTADKSTSFHTTVSTSSLDPATATAISEADLANRYPGQTFPLSAEVDIVLDNGTLKVKAQTNIGTAISATLSQTGATESPYQPMADVSTWRQFKEYVATLEARHFLFRGQAEQWRLRSTFHRTGRADIVRYLQEDIPQLYRHLSSRTRHMFDLSVPDENGAFLSLVQHHGYPTPLLDWSYSPFVAAFFAYRNVPKDSANSEDPNGKVRIFVFDHRLWHKNWSRAPLLRAFGPNVTVLEFLSVENDRLIPQQSVSTITNIDDIEAYLESREKSDGANYLRVIDLSWKERSVVMRELDMMGITAGALFPGLDGACAELRERNF